MSEQALKDEVVEENTTVGNETAEQAQVTEKPAQLKTVETKEPTKVVSVEAKAKKPRQQKRVSRQEIIKQQANPSTRLAGRQKTISLKLTYTSDIMHEYLILNQSKMLDAYERMAGLLRMVAQTPDLFAHVNDWIAKNVEIARAQLQELSAHRETIVANIGEVDAPEINIPESYHTEFEASHPIAHKMIAMLRLVDVELNECETLYMSGVIDDLQYKQLFNQATSVIRGTVDRIFKATTPGKRKSDGRYNPAQLAAWLREGNKMLFGDIPHHLNHIIEDAA
jgi:hypothetical protein